MSLDANVAQFIYLIEYDGENNFHNKQCMFESFISLLSRFLLAQVCSAIQK